MSSKFLSIITVLFISTMVMAQNNSPVVKSTLPAVKYFENKEGAIRGYDPVAYFKEGKAVKGAEQFVYAWSGSNWYFKDESNKQTFMVAPQKYAPRYGGFCAFGTSENHLSPADPNAFTIVNDTLYLNYNAKVREMWQKNMDQRIEKADLFWPSLNSKR